MEMSGSEQEQKDQEVSYDQFEYMERNSEVNMNRFNDIFFRSNQQNRPQQPPQNSNNTIQKSQPFIKNANQGQLNTTKSSNATSTRKINMTLPKVIHLQNNIFVPINPPRNIQEIEQDIYDQKHKLKNQYNKDLPNQKKVQTHKLITSYIHRTINKQYEEIQIQKQKEKNIQQIKVKGKDKKYKKDKKDKTNIYNNDQSCYKACKKLGFIPKTDNKGEQQFEQQQDDQKCLLRQRQMIKLNNNLNNNKMIRNAYSDKNYFKIQVVDNLEIRQYLVEQKGLQYRVCYTIFIQYLKQQLFLPSLLRMFVSVP